MCSEGRTTAPPLHIWFGGAIKPSSPASPRTYRVRARPRGRAVILAKGGGTFKLNCACGEKLAESEITNDVAVMKRCCRLDPTVQFVMVLLATKLFKDKHIYKAHMYHRTEDFSLYRDMDADDRKRISK